MAIGDIYPACVDQIGESYDLKALEATLEEDAKVVIADLTHVKSFDICML